jgi:hypothetical protein
LSQRLDLPPQRAILLVRAARSDDLRLCFLQLSFSLREIARASD